MAKVINLKYKGVEYTLEFTRESVKQMERNGFRVKDISEKPANTLPTLFAGAFLAHHRAVKQEVIDELFRMIPNKMDFVEKLADMYNEPIESLLDDPETPEGNVEWGANW